MKNIFKIAMFFLLVFTYYLPLSCAPIKSTWSSTPDFQNTGNTYYDTTFTPVKGDHNYYVGFSLDVFNKTTEEIQIDWNKTMYILHGKKNGVFVFQGIKPEDIRNLTIPADVIPPGAKFSKLISPFKTLAYAPVKYNVKGKGINPGILPDGENGISLVVRQGDKEINEKLTVNIKEIKE